MKRQRIAGGVVSAIGASALLAAAALGPMAAAQAKSSHGAGSSYGWQGGVNPELALANVKSGLYGLRYTYDRAHYDFRGCPDPHEAAIGYSPVCPPPFFR